VDLETSIWVGFRCTFVFVIAALIRHLRSMISSKLSILIQTSSIFFTRMSTLLRQRPLIPWEGVWTLIPPLDNKECRLVIGFIINVPLGGILLIIMRNFDICVCARFLWCFGHSFIEGVWALGSKILKSLKARSVNHFWLYLFKRPSVIR
jgi:hypothetical protein